MRWMTLCLCMLVLTVQASEQNTYEFKWLDPDKEVYILQNRKYRKVGELYFNLGAGLTTSGAFVDSLNFQGRAGYFMWEDWGVELLYSQNSGEENTTAKSVRLAGSTVPFRRIVESYYGAMLMWSPFYTKTNTFNSIIYMDWLIGLGFASLTEKNNRSEFDTSGSYNDGGTSETHAGLMWNLGLKIYISESWSSRIDLTTIHYQAKKAEINTTKEQFYSNYDLTFSIGYAF